MFYSASTICYSSRNLKQIQNLQQKCRERTWLSQDDLYNVHELAYDLNSYVIKVSTYPNFVVICGLEQLIQQLNTLCDIKSSVQQQLLSYDTTFQLGDFYVSPLLFQHVMFSTSPVIPALFLIHERKFYKVHAEFMQTLAEKAPNLVQRKHIIPLVTDEEVGIVETVGKYLSRYMQRVGCWNHVINAVKLWLKKHGASFQEIPVYILPTYIRDLLNQPNYESYLMSLKEYEVKWS